MRAQVRRHNKSQSQPTPFPAHVAFLSIYEEFVYLCLPNCLPGHLPHYEGVSCVARLPSYLTFVLYDLSL